MSKSAAECWLKEEPESLYLAGNEQLRDRYKNYTLIMVAIMS